MILQYRRLSLADGRTTWSLHEVCHLKMFTEIRHALLDLLFTGSAKKSVVRVDHEGCCSSVKDIRRIRHCRSEYSQCPLPAALLPFTFLLYLRQWVCHNPLKVKPCGISKYSLHMQHLLVGTRQQNPIALLANRLSGLALWKHVWSSTWVLLPRFPNSLPHGFPFPCGHLA